MENSSSSPEPVEPKNNQIVVGDADGVSVVQPNTISKTSKSKTMVILEYLLLALAILTLLSLMFSLRGLAWITLPSMLIVGSVSLIVSINNTKVLKGSPDEKQAKISRRIKQLGLAVLILVGISPILFVGFWVVFIIIAIASSGGARSESNPNGS